MEIIRQDQAVAMNNNAGKSEAEVTFNNASNPATAL